jgi:hypothetical protein
MIVLAIDQGSQYSAFVLLDTANCKLIRFGKVPNDGLLHDIKSGHFSAASYLVIEHIAMGGMIAGQETFDACMWGGRFIEAWGGSFYTLLKRHAVKMHLCNSTRAKDSNIRQALIDKFSNGKGKDVAIGKKKSPGPLFGVAADVWSALAIAVTWTDTISAAHAPGKPVAA